MKQREVKRMAAYEVIPEGTWGNAIECTVKNLDTGKVDKNCPLIRRTPETSHEHTFSIKWRKLPVVILNEKNPVDPNDAQPITDDAQRLNTMSVTGLQGVQNPMAVRVLKNEGWPNGTILIP